MEKRVIICISREYGSDGSLVGKKLAEKLDIPFYDKKLLERMAVEYGLSEKLIESADEQPVTLSSMGFPRGIRNPYKNDFDALYYVINDKIFNLQSQTIRKIAGEGSCVIIGRVAETILKDDPDRISIFVHADIEYRINSVIKQYGYDYKTAKYIIRRTDKNREKYHNYYADTKWGHSDSYDISISTSKFGVDGVAEFILNLIK